MTIAARARHAFEGCIQVSGRIDFLRSRWRDAILFYVFGVWANREEVMYRPKISFGDITLRLDRQQREYYAYGHAEVPQAVPPLDENDLVETSGQQDSVEVALIRFVKDDRIRQLRLRFLSVSDDVATLVLWKKERRGEYGYAGLGLPYSWGTRGPVWTRAEYERQ